MKIQNTSKKNDLIVGPAVAVDTLIFTIRNDNLMVLLIKIKNGPYKYKWALPGGLVQIDETLDTAAKRVLNKKAGVKGVYLEQLYTFSDLNRDKRGRIISVAYFALVNSDRLKLKTLEDFYSDIAWKNINSLPSLAFDHKKIISYGLERLKRKMEYTNVAYGFLPQEFTLTEMQKVYEIVWNKKLDKRNFRKQIKKLNIIEAVGKKTSTKSRPAELFRFKERKLVFTK